MVDIFIIIISFSYKSGDHKKVELTFFMQCSKFVVCLVCNPLPSYIRKVVTLTPTPPVVWIRRCRTLPLPFLLHHHFVLFQVLLVFGKDDAQCSGLRQAAEVRGYPCDVIKSSEAVIPLYIERHHDVIIIDHRSSRTFDGEGLCR